MGRRKELAEMTNMVMICDKQTGKVLVQNRVKSWCGISFPGGHIEPGESAYDSAVREMREETGLTVSNLKLCGVMHWYNTEKAEWYIEYFYKTTDYEGELIPETEEGKIFWVTLEELDTLPLAPNFKEYLPLFLDDRYSEGYCAWDTAMDAQQYKIIYR